MLTDAKPIPAVTANTKVKTHTTQPVRDGARRRACQSTTAHDGMTSATRSAATPMARKSHPAVSLDPSERANQPLVVISTMARANAAASNRIEAADHRCGATAVEAIALA